jgi:hypothetical protein
VLSGCVSGRRTLPDAAQLIAARRLQAVFERANAVAFGAGAAKRRGSEFRQDFADLNA